MGAGMKLYAVAFEITMNIVAEDEDSALRIATRNVKNEDAESFLLLSLREGAAAAGWSDSAIPYADHRIDGDVGTWRKR